jgi:hypothetical protein
MTYKVSTGLRNYMLATGSARAALANGKLMIYSGAEPATADAAPTGTLLCVIDKDGLGAGFTLDSVALDGILAKVAADILSGTVLISGTAGYYRHVGASDTGVLSTTEPRIQGRIATSGAEANLSSTALVAGATQTADEYSINLPTF